MDCVQKRPNLGRRATLDEVDVQQRHCSSPVWARARIAPFLQPTLGPWKSPVKCLL
jgi:hypothetical protein